MKLYKAPTKISAAGSPPKSIEEFIGRVNSKNGDVSIARMRSPEGWNEPGQTPEFTEHTIVLRGTLVVETKSGPIEMKDGEAITIDKGEWVRYSTPYSGGAEYIAVCLPAFSPDIVHRERTEEA
ncbi:MAG TPA: cupin [Bacteroidota bacterium]|nr:cupin [Bacteroidota bacterium]